MCLIQKAENFEKHLAKKAENVKTIEELKAKFLNQANYAKELKKQFKTDWNTFQKPVHSTCVLQTFMHNTHQLFVIEVNKRLELYNYLRENHIYSQIHYIPIHTFPYYNKIGYKDANLICSDNYYKKCLSLPMFPSLTNKEQNFVIDKVIEFVKN